MMLRRRGLAMVNESANHLREMSKGWWGDESVVVNRFSNETGGVDVGFKLKMGTVGWDSDASAEFFGGVRRFSADVSHHATLKVTDGLTWNVKLKRGSNGFQIGRLVPFIEYYSINGHLLLFKYHGDWQFQVVILDISACEIEYPAADEDNSDDHSLEGGSTWIKSSDEE